MAFRGPNPGPTEVLDDTATELDFSFHKISFRYTGRDEESGNKCKLLGVTYFITDRFHTCHYRSSIFSYMDCIDLFSSMCEKYFFILFYL